MQTTVKILLCWALVLGGQAAWAQGAEETGLVLAGALAAADAGDWGTARAEVEATGDPVALAVITWKRLRAGEGSFGEYQRFLAAQGDWPGLKLLRKAGEESIPEGTSAADLALYFGATPPQTGTGALRLAAALQAQGRIAEARSGILQAWTGLDLTADEQEQMIAAWGGLLAGHYETRLDNLLWRGESRQAERMLPLVGRNMADLARVRIALRRAEDGVNALIEALPKDLQNDPGLAYERFMWRIKKDRWDDATTLLLQHTGAAATLGKPEDWANMRRSVARREVRLGDAADGYVLASQHFLTSGESYADLEWLSGWIALRRLNDPTLALQHFTRFRDAVISPISMGRAGYWLGRTYEALGQTQQAAQAYAMAAAYQTSFYGQLAAERAGLPTDPSLAGTGPQPSWQGRAFLGLSAVQAGILFHHADESVEMQRFFSHVAETMTPEDQAALAALAMDLERPNVALSVGKIAAERGVVIPVPYYPVTELARYSVDIAPEMAMAIARQESELNPEVVSSAGAMGLMQVMPGTASKVAQELGIDYAKTRLTSDWRYNARLGTAYMAGLLRDFDGAAMLAIAGYNAGPNRVNQWIDSYGDPRSASVDAIDWIEMIPYRETQNYVQRVLESLHVYRARIGGQSSPVRLTSDMARIRF